jgi:hypothetical protein
MWGTLFEFFSEWFSVHFVENDEGTLFEIFSEGVQEVLSLNFQLMYSALRIRCEWWKLIGESHNVCEVGV